MNPNFYPTNAKDWAKLALIVVAVTAIGLFAMNQFIQYHFAIAFLQTPCSLCVDLNPQYLSCFTSPIANAPQLNITGWWSPNG